MGKFETFMAWACVLMGGGNGIDVTFRFSQWPFDHSLDVHTFWSSDGEVGVVLSVMVGGVGVLGEENRLTNSLESRKMNSSRPVVLEQNTNTLPWEVVLKRSQPAAHFLRIPGFESVR